MFESMDELNPLKMAALLLDRTEKWHLEWEVLWVTFATLIQVFGVKPEAILESIRSGFDEWDV